MRIATLADGLVQRAGFPLAIARDGDILRRIEHVCYIYVLTMEAFRPYVARLEELLGRSMRPQRDVAFPKDLDAALDGQPSAELRRQVPIDVLRGNGAFFTGSAMAKLAITAAGLHYTAEVKVLDPACGAGDLLVAMVSHLPCSSDLSSTLRDWGQQVLALDLQPDFVRATKLRLALAAIRRQSQRLARNCPSLDELFPGIGLGSSLVEEDVYKQATHILINPPFTPVDAPDDLRMGKWEGKLRRSIHGRLLITFGARHSDYRDSAGCSSQWL